MKKAILGILLPLTATAAMAQSALSQLKFEAGDDAVALSQQVKPAPAAVLPAKKPQMPAKTREFYLESYGRRWRMRPDLNPPGSELTINVVVGEHVRLRLALLPFGPIFAQAGFDVDGIDSTIDGQASKGIHVLLRSAPEEAVVEFDAPKEGLYPIYDNWGSGNRIGLIIIRKH